MRKLVALSLVLALALSLMAVSLGAAEGEVRKLKLASHNAEIEGNPYRVRSELDIQEAAKAALEKGFDISYSS